MIRFVAGFLAGLLAALFIASPVRAGVNNCRPAWKCAATATLTPTANPTPISSRLAPPTPAPTIPPDSYTVPTSIDSTGATDASPGLSAFIASVPDNSTIVFRPGTYRLDAGLRLIERHGLTFEGQGATLRATPTTGQPRTSPFLLEGGSGYTIRDFTLLGTNADGGTANSHHLAAQDQGGVNAYGVQGLLIERVTIRRTWGDCVYLGLHQGSIWVDGAVWRDSVCELNGRMGIAVVAGRNVVVERVTFTGISMFPFDIEPDSSTQGGTNIRFSDSTITGYGLTPLFTNYFFAASGAAGSLVRDVTVTRNTVTGGPGLRVVVGLPVRQNIAVTDNWTSITRPGPVMEFYNVAGVTVTGNRQPLSSGGLAYFENCSGIVYTGNVTS